MISPFPLVAGLIVVCLCAKLLYSYAAKDASLLVYLCTFTSWILSFGIIAILPYDVYQSLANQRDPDLKFVWDGIYWTVFALCWLVLPLLQCYLLAGDFSFFRRCCSALLMHAWMLTLFGAGTAAIIIYLLIVQEMTKDKVTAVLMVLGNTWGLFLVMTLLGYGLIEVPRSFWRKGNMKGYRKFYHYQAYVVNKLKTKAEMKIVELAKMILAADVVLPVHHKRYKYIRILKAKIPTVILSDIIKSRIHENRLILDDMKSVTKRRLEKIHKRLKIAVGDYYRAIARWEHHCTRAFRHDDILKNVRNGRMRVESMLWTQRTGMCVRTREFVEWMWLTQLRPWANRGVAVACAVMSCVIIVGEGTLSMRLPFGLYQLYQSNHGDIQTQLLVCIPLLYIVFCVYFALFSLRLSGFYGIYSKNQTDPLNMLWCAQFLCQLIAPLCYNFLSLIDVKNTDFSHIMDVIDAIPVLGTLFCKYFPLTLVVFAGMNLLQVYTRLLNLVGLERFRFSERYEDDRVEEGKERLRMERIAREGKSEPTVALISSESSP